MLKQVAATYILLSAGTYAQQVTGSITGSATDRSGAAVTGAQVRLTNPATGLVRTAQSDSEGNYRFLLLPVGVYTLEASSAGFKAFKRDGIVVEADRSLSVPIGFELGAVTEVIEVTGGAELLEPNTSQLGTVMDRRKVEDLPLNGRNPMGLANLVPTVRGIGFFGGMVLSSWRLAAVSIGGGQPLSSGFSVDGIAAEKMFTSGTQNFPTVDSTNEFKIITNAMSAEFGRTGGGIVSVITKSGTNEFHGNLFEFVRNDNLNANDFFNNRNRRTRPSLAWNQFGGTLGGPIKRDKLFFFGNYEAFRERRVGTTILNSPTTAERGGDFSDTRAAGGALIMIFDPTTTRPDPAAAGRFVRTAFPGNMIPASRINRVGAGIISHYPLPNQAGQPVTRAQNLFLAGPGPIDRDTITGKIDWNVSSSRRLNGRYTWDDLDWQFARTFNTPAEADGRAVLIPRNSFSLNYTDTLRPTLLLDVKAGFNRENEHFFTPSEGFDITSIGFPEAFKRLTYRGRGADTGRFPRTTVSDLGTFGAIASRGNPSLTTLTSANVSKLTARHTVKTGFEYRFYSRNDYGRECSVGCYTFNRAFTQGPDPLVAGAASGFSVASLLLGLPASANTTLRTDTSASLRYYAGFVQDDWKITPKFTLNLGLRWDYEGPITDRYNVLSNFDPGIQSPLQVPGLSLRGGLVYPGSGGLDRGVSERQFSGWQPRFGYAYQLNQKTVLRGGYGIIYVPTTPVGDVAQTGFSQDTVMNVSLDGGLTPNHTLSDPYPSGLLEPSGNRLGALTGVGNAISGQLRDVRRGYTQQWNFTVQHQPWNNWLFEAAWVGNRGTRLVGFTRQLNFPGEQTLALGTQLNLPVTNPFRGIIATGPLSGATITRLQASLPFPQFTGVTGVNGGYFFLGNSTYHALAVKVEKRFSTGFSLIAAYTASKLIDDGQNTAAIRPGGVNSTGVQNWNNLRAERSKSAQDLPQRLVLTTLYELPLFRTGSRLTRAALGGWQVNGILTLESGTPISLSAPGINGVGNRPNVRSGVPYKVDSPMIDRWFDRNAFENPAPYTFGNVSRTLPDLHSDGLFNLDFSLFKDFAVTERFKLQLRGEAFNLTNTPTFDTPDRSVTSQLFGVVSAMAFNPKPREVQLALKLVF
jgi:outer membrane receptor protein involved in Fe transport